MNWESPKKKGGVCHSGKIGEDCGAAEWRRSTENQQEEVKEKNYEKKPENLNQGKKRSELNVYAKAAIGPAKGIKTKKIKGNAGGMKENPEGVKKASFCFCGHEGAEAGPGGVKKEKKPRSSEKEYADLQQSSKRWR